MGCIRGDTVRDDDGSTLLIVVSLALCGFILATTFLTTSHLMTARFSANMRATNVEVAARSVAIQSMRMLMKGQVPANRIYVMGNVTVVQTRSGDSSLQLTDVATNADARDKIQFGYDTIGKVILYWHENAP